ncbi:MAG TPA: PRC-barrel domain-containing protein [Acidobacteriaceae bacterium]
MAHYGTIGSQAASKEIHDVRGTKVSGADGTSLGRVVEAILDHATMKIRYLVVDSEGMFKRFTYLLPADRISADEQDEDGLVAAVTRQQIEESVQYNADMLRSEDDWRKYEQEFKEYWEEQPVMARKDTPSEEPIPQAAATNETNESGSRKLNPAKLYPERITPVFSDPAPGSSKVMLRPKSVARAEDAASGTTLLKPRWWDDFESYLRNNKEGIQAHWSQGSAKTA